MAAFEQLRLEIVENLKTTFGENVLIQWEFPQSYPQKTGAGSVFVGIGGISLEESMGGGLGSLVIRFQICLPTTHATDFQPFVHKLYQVMSKGKWGLSAFSCKELTFDRASGNLLAQAKAELYGRFDPQNGEFFPLPSGSGGGSGGGGAAGSLLVKINQTPLPAVQSFKGKTVKESRMVEAFGQSEAVAVVAGAVCYRLELCWAASDFDQKLRDLTNFTVTVSDFFGDETYSGCQWLSRGRALQKDGQIFQTALVEATSFRYLPHPAK